MSRTAQSLPQVVFVLGRELCYSALSSAPACWELLLLQKLLMEGMLLASDKASDDILALLEKEQQPESSFITPYNQNKLVLCGSLFTV